MCGWCCGGVPVERRGSGHTGCSEQCYNAPGNAALTAERKAREEAEAARLIMERDRNHAQVRAEQSEAALADLRAKVAGLADRWERTHLTGFCDNGCDSIARGNKAWFVSDLRAATLPVES